MDLQGQPEEKHDAIGSEASGSEGGPDPGERLGALQVLGSIFAAGLGVQSSRNRERDFRQGRAGVFIAAGFLFTALFVGCVFFVVKMVLAGRGG